MKRRTCLQAVAVTTLAGCAAPRFAESTNPAEWTAAEALRNMRERTITAEGYARILLARCEAARGLNAISWIDPERALASARAVDAARARGDKMGALAGLPLLMKDNIDTVGFPTSAATPVLRANLPKANAPVVDTLFARGAYLLAKANMAEMALSGTSSESVFGSVRNPYDVTRFSGGSSGGTAAGIAARLAPAGLGSDTAGSGRIPAAFCGVVGYRPTTQPRAAYTNKGVVPLSRSLDTIAPMARSVSDVALLHAAILGEETATPLTLKGVRFGIARRFLWDDLDPEVARVTADAMAKLKDAGAEFVEIDLKDIPEASWGLQRNMMLAGMKQDLGNYLREGGSALTAAQVLAGIEAPQIAGLFKSVAGMPMTEEQARHQLEVQAPALRARFEAALHERQLAAIMFPCEFIPAQPIKRPDDTSPWMVNGKPVGQQMLSRNTRLAAALGLPALAIPTGLTAQGLPVSLEFNGLGGHDRRLLGVGQSIESAIGRLPGPRS
jgi:Asp-tRNA(Asn)/Glu-tRNA(Gln) amidotransferase A subunit family amidase